jgi:hypothetical protein
MAEGAGEDGWTAWVHGQDRAFAGNERGGLMRGEEAKLGGGAGAVLVAGLGSVIRSDDYYAKLVE